MAIIPVIPQSIVVHLGRPASNAQNVTVSFINYIKNVASSEIYPTWDESAIVANIYAQISFALNRIYLEFYPSQGYNFNITNSTAYDQSFTYGRNIFENISKLVDELFNDYLRRPGVTEPLAAKYCNGTTVTCNGLSQWGSQNLAQQGYDSLGILRYYYGANIELVTNAPVANIRASYPGYPLQKGSRGPNVEIIQVSLNRVSQNYPLIPKVYPVDGLFGAGTEAAVKKFQGIFDLTPDGIVGKATWYKLLFLYVGIKKLGELESEGQRLFGYSLEYPDAISEGDTGQKVLNLQYFLSVLSEFYATLPAVTITGTFGPVTKNAVLAFQQQVGLPQTGVVNDVTWNELYNAYQGVVSSVLVPKQNSFIPAQAFGGTVLQLGSRGADVKSLQTYLHTISATFQGIPPVVPTGLYDQRTMLAVLQYQALAGLPRTGQVDRTIWNSIINTYKDVLSATTTSPRQYPGYVLFLGSSDPV